MKRSVADFEAEFVVTDDDLREFARLFASMDEFLTAGRKMDWWDEDEGMEIGREIFPMSTVTKQIQDESERFRLNHNYSDSFKLKHTYNPNPTILAKSTPNQEELLAGEDRAISESVSQEISTYQTFTEEEEGATDDEIFLATPVTSSANLPKEREAAEPEKVCQPLDNIDAIFASLIEVPPKDLAYQMVKRLRNYNCECNPMDYQERVREFCVTQGLDHTSVWSKFMRLWFKYDKIGNKTLSSAIQRARSNPIAQQICPGDSDFTLVYSVCYHLSRNSVRAFYLSQESLKKKTGVDSSEILRVMVGMGVIAVMDEGDRENKLSASYKWMTLD